MKKKLFILSALCCFNILPIFSQTVSGISDLAAGYFNGHEQATYTSASAGSLGGNAFTITGSGNSLHGAYGPDVPSNAGFNNFTNSILNNSVSYRTVIFSKNLTPLDQLIVMDVDYTEAVSLSFLDSFNAPVSVVENIKLVSLTNLSVNAATIAYPNATTVTITGQGAGADQGFAFVFLNDIVRSVVINQTAAYVGGFNFTFTKGKPDRGDAPAIYGDPMHLPINRLKLGANAPDADPSPLHNDQATGDHTVGASPFNVIHDEDGVAAITPIANDGTHGQLIPVYSVECTAFNATGADANIVAWIDWNGNGVFEETEAVTAANLASTAAIENRTFTWTNMPLSGDEGRAGTYMRIRISTGALSASTPDGFMPDGEVEDYYIPFATALPVELSQFSVTKKEENLVLLTWQTASEQNSKGFEIERSEDGLLWNTIGHVASKAMNGNSSSVLHYDFADNSPLQGRNFYRLKQLDFDGRFDFSKVLWIQMDAVSRIRLYPNPTSGIINISGLKQGSIITLYSTAGNRVSQVTADKKYMRIPVSHLPASVYKVVVTEASGRMVSNHTFVKTH